MGWVLREYDGDDGLARESEISLVEARLLFRAFHPGCGLSPYVSNRITEDSFIDFDAEGAALDAGESVINEERNRT